jgi:hypothetical protein
MAPFSFGNRLLLFKTELGQRRHKAPEKSLSECRLAYWQLGSQLCLQCRILSNVTHGSVGCKGLLLPACSPWLPPASPWAPPCSRQSCSRLTLIRQLAGYVEACQLIFQRHGHVLEVYTCCSRYAAATFVRSRYATEVGRSILGMYTQSECNTVLFKCRKVA